MRRMTPSPSLLNILGKQHLRMVKGIGICFFTYLPLFCAFYLPGEIICEEREVAFTGGKVKGGDEII